MDSAGELYGHDDITDADNLLVLDPPDPDIATSVCADLLATHADTESGFICIALHDSACEHLTELQPALPDQAPTEAALITTDTTNTAPALEEWVGHACPVETIPAPGAVSDLGIALSTYLDRWQGHVEPFICMQSLTALLNELSLQEAYRFLTVMTSQITSEDAAAHYHLDPEAQDERTIDILSMVFDVVIEPVTADDWIVTAP